MNSTTSTFALKRAPSKLSKLQILLFTLVFFLLITSSFILKYGKVVGFTQNFDFVAANTVKIKPEITTGLTKTLNHPVKRPHLLPQIPKPQVPETQTEYEETSIRNHTLRNIDNHSDGRELRVVLVANEYVQQFPLIGYGGVEAHVEAEAEGLHRLGVDFVVITPKIQIRRKIYNFTVLETKASPGKKLLFIEDVKNIINQMDPLPDVIWSQSDWSGKHLQSLGIPMIVSHHDSRGSQDTTNVRLQYYPHVWNRFISSNQRDHWCQVMPWLTNNSFVQWYGFPQDEFVLETNKDPKTLLYVGQLSKDKGLHEFIELARKNPDWQFKMYGSGAMRHLTPPNLHFLGELKRGEEHHNAFKRATKFFMYVKWEEAFGRVIVEALSKGTPVIGSTKGSLPELIPPLVGTLSEDLEVINQALRQDFNYTQVYNYAKENFDSVLEVQKMLRYSVQLITETRNSRLASQQQQRQLQS